MYANKFKKPIGRIPWPKCMQCICKPPIQGKGKESKRKAKWLENLNKMKERSPKIMITAINVKTLSSLIKDRCSIRVKGKNSVSCCLQKICLKACRKAKSRKREQDIPDTMNHRNLH